MNNKKNKPDLKTEKKFYKGRVVRNFEYKKKKSFAGTQYKTESKALFEHLLTTKRIIK